MRAVRSTDFRFDGLEGVYRGKVRDVYFVKGKLISVATDRISAFDHILPKPIPAKGQVLNQIAAYFLQECSDIVPVWLEAVPDPQVSAGKICEPIKVEMVIRGYLAGHAWREYSSGKTKLSGVDMPGGLKESDPFPEPIVTPATKAEQGHDEDISREEIIRSGLVEENLYEKMESITRQLYKRGSDMAGERGLILVDTKYEFGLHEGELMLIDEVHTPDSSRYYYLDTYEERQKEGLPQLQLSKEFVREWLMENGFQGKPGQSMPDMPESFVQQVSRRYIELYEKLTGNTFVYPAGGDPLKRIETNIEEYISKL